MVSAPPPWPAATAPGSRPTLADHALGQAECRAAADHTLRLLRQRPGQTLHARSPRFLRWLAIETWAGSRVDSGGTHRFREHEQRSDQTPSPVFRCVSSLWMRHRLPRFQASRELTHCFFHGMEVGCGALEAIPSQLVDQMLGRDHYGQFQGPAIQLFMQLI